MPHRFGQCNRQMKVCIPLMGGAKGSYNPLIMGPLLRPWGVNGILAQSLHP